MAVHVVNEAKRCLNCKKPMCREGCPINTPIPQMIQAFLSNDINGAGAMLFENNPLSIVCSLVCDHEKQCEGHCVLGRKGSPVQISSIENYISDSYFDRMVIDREPSNGMKAAIIGAGLILYSLVFGHEKMQKFFNIKVFKTITSCSLLCYCLCKAYSFFTSVNGYYNFFDTLIDLQTPGNIFSGGLIFILNVCVGLVVSCTMYGFYSLFKRGEI